jgi:hypothetical protein
MSFPPGTEMFQFPGFASPPYVFRWRYPKGVGCPIRISTDQSLLAAPRGFSQRATSFIASWCQGIHRMPLSCSISHGTSPKAMSPPLKQFSVVSCQGSELLPFPKFPTPVAAQSYLLSTQQSSPERFRVAGATLPIWFPIKARQTSGQTTATQHAQRRTKT